MIDFVTNRYDTLGSTNVFLSQLAEKKEIKEGYLVSAGEQTFGKGYGENKWESEKDKNLLFSFYIEPVFMNAADQFYISMITSISLFETIYSFLTLPGITIKWPNDIFYKKKKLAGILIENNISGNNISSSVIGVGLNVNQTKFTDSLPNPDSMALIAKKEFNSEDILELFTERFNIWYEKLKNNLKEQIKDTYLNSLYKIDTMAKFKTGDKTFKGKIRDIDQFGRLIIESENKKLTFGFKEIEYIL